MGILKCKIVFIVYLFIFFLSCKEDCKRNYGDEEYTKFCFVKHTLKQYLFGEYHDLELEKKRKLTELDFKTVIKACNDFNYEYKVTEDSSILIKKKYVGCLSNMSALSTYVESEIQKIKLGN